MSTRAHVPARVRRSHRLLAGTAALVTALTLTPAGTAVAAAAPKPKVICKAGTIPKVNGKGARAKLVIRRGKAVCVAPPKAKPSNIEPAASAPQGTVSSTADALTQALLVKPDAFAGAEQKIGKKATQALIAQGMTGWRAGAQARRLAEQGFHSNTTFGDANKGTTGFAKIDVDPAGDGGIGNKASATIEFSADAKGLKDLGADKAVSAKSAKVRLDIAFEDIPAACPTADGKVKGSLKATAKLTLTIDGKETTMAADIQATYELTVGADAHWKTIDNVDVQTTFSFGGTGKGTETWRGRRGGSGFGHTGIFGEGSAPTFEAGLKEQQSHLDQNFGGVWGPKSRVLYSDPSTDNAFNYGGSIDHLKGLAITEIATQYLTYAAVEYIRQVVGPRGDRHWYNDEACLKLDATPDKSKLRAGEQATVTAQNAKAADGTPVAVNTTETGVATFEPASAAIPASGSKGFTLTAPNETPTRSNWQIVALSPAGKKTLSGSLGGDATYTLTLADRESYVTTEAGYDYEASATLTGTLGTSAVAGSSPSQSMGSGGLAWSDRTEKTNLDYSWLEQPIIESGSWSATVTSNPDGTISVKVDVPGSKINYTLVNDPPYDSGCTCDPPRVEFPSMPGPMPISLWQQPLVFTLPSTGGVVPFDQFFGSGDDGWRSKGTLTVTPGNPA